VKVFFPATGEILALVAGEYNGNIVLSFSNSPIDNTEVSIRARLQVLRIHTPS
jgi:hypothetical protein